MPRKPIWTVLGSGGGEAAPDRASSGHLLETPHASILFDCGDSVTGSFLRVGKRYEDLDAIIISHTHPDHICGLPFFLQQMYLAWRLRELTVYVPIEALRGIQSMLKMHYLFFEHLSFPINFVGLYSRPVFVCGDVAIKPHLNTHLVAHRGQPWMAEVDNEGESYSFECSIGDVRFAYSADIGSLDDLEFCDGCRTLFVESTHVDLPELYARAENWRIKQLILIHVCPGFVPQPPAGRVFRDLRLAEDGLIVPLTD